MTETTALTVVDTSSVDLGMMRVSKPADVLRVGAEIATPLAKFIKDRDLSVRLGNNEYVLLEAWNTLGTMMGVTPHEVGVEEHDGIFTAKVELRRIADGKAIASASAECGSDDEKDKFGRPTWASRPRYARRSMAITRATAKAGRMAFGWVMTLAGYQTTPAEEMQPLHDAGIIETPAQPVVAPKPHYAPKAAPLDTIPFEDEDNTPLPDEPHEPVYIAKLTQRKGTKNGKDYTQYFITLSDGRTGSFFNGELGVSAQAAFAAKVPVVAQFEQQGRFTNLVSLLRA